MRDCSSPGPPAVELGQRHARDPVEHARAERGDHLLAAERGQIRLPVRRGVADDLRAEDQHDHDHEHVPIRVRDEDVAAQVLGDLGQRDRRDAGEDAEERPDDEAAVVRVAPRAAAPRGKRRVHRETFAAAPQYLGCEFTVREVVISTVDCFFHNAVPSVAPCRGCKKPVCATCRNENGDCPGCVLAARIDAARQTNMINGGVGPSYGSYSEPQHQAAYSAPPQPQPPPPPQRAARRPRSPCAPETRAVVALGYPFWPLALIALLDGKASHFVKRQAWQALGFNLGMYGLGALLSAAAAIPILGLGAWPLLPFIFPVTIVASIVYAFKVWQGDDVDVPIVSDWVDARLPGGTGSPQGQS